MRILRLLCLVIYLSVFNMHAQTAIPVATKDLDLNYTRQIDSIINDAIVQEAFPGVQILVAHNDTVVFHKSYGFHTYDSLKTVKNNDLYDLASVTKILGPLPAIMKFVEQGKLNLDLPFSTYWKPWQKVEDKKDLTLREILSHQAGLKSYIIFLNSVLKKNGKIKNRFVRRTKSKRFNKQIYKGLYIKNTFNKYVYRKISSAAPLRDKKYLYSGLSFLIYPSLIEQISGQSYADYLKENFYAPLGAKTLGFNPTDQGYPNEIVPTEVDTLFRMDLTQGYVHDENAALLGGISGNAGLFATADDVLRMMLMYNHYGKFQGKRYLSEDVVKEFAKIQYPANGNRRGLGFDKPLIHNDTLAIDLAYPAPEVSSNSFGHSGFTGTFTWTDPENGITFILLSNRVYPSRSHRNIYNLNIRPKLQQLFYKVLLNKED